MDTWVRPIRRGWVVRDRVPGPDVDEFAEPDAVVAALASPEAAGDTLLAVQHPARTPAALARGLDLNAALPSARAALARIRALHYRSLSGFVAAYRIDGPDGAASGVLCLVDLSELNSGRAHVRHTEEVYPHVVAERAAVLAGLGCATSAAMLVPAEDGALLTEAVESACAGLGTPDVSTVDLAGRRHELWAVPSGTVQARLLTAVARSDLLVADGNHRVAAAAATGQGALLALVTAGPRLEIGAINRVLTGFSAAELTSAWRAAGLEVSATADRTPPSCPGTVVVLAGDEALRVTLPVAGSLMIDHEAVERVLFEQALGVDPDGPAVRPLPAGRPVPPGALVQLAPVPFETVLKVHAAGRRLPRKATYFTPKPLGGLVLAEI
jgi:hypothetical protein